MNQRGHSAADAEFGCSIVGGQQVHFGPPLRFRFGAPLLLREINSPIAITSFSIRPSTFRQLWTSIYIPEATTEQWEWFNEMQRISTSPENAARLFEEWGRIDVTGALPHIRVPTIVFHCEHDGAVPFEEGRRMASAIPGAQFVPLPSRNHLVLADEPAWKLFLEELGRFLGWHPSVRAG
jgi:pimeloyl-ACP methyl ester carboxylesterase